MNMVIFNVFQRDSSPESVTLPSIDIPIGIGNGDNIEVLRKEWIQVIICIRTSRWTHEEVQPGRQRELLRGVGH